jgi:hypothetical protein
MVFRFNFVFALSDPRAGAGYGGWSDRAPTGTSSGRAGTAGHFARGTQIGHQVAHRQRDADRLFGKRLAVRRDHLGTGFDAAARQRDIGCNDDIAFARAFRNPVVGGVHPGTGRDALD